MIAVCVTFDIKPDQMAAFMPLMQAQASNSLRAEPGCRHFDICTVGAHDTRVFLYELYSDRAAFDDHLASEHFKEFDAAVAEMIKEKSVAIYGEVSQG